MDKAHNPLQINFSTARNFPLKKNVFQIMAMNVAGEEISRLRKWKGLIKVPKVINIRLISNRQIKKMNKDFLGRAYATDVISFSYIDKKPVTYHERDKNDPVVLGDVAVSYEMARLRCFEYKNSFKNELALYIIHGILHVFGYRDTDKKSEKKMRIRQNYYFKKFFSDKSKRYSQ